jgi:hemerythrin-like metal-binding protein
MAFLDFSEKLSVKVGQIDEQHKSLINIINDLHEAMASGKGRMVVDDILSRLIDYTKMHFGTEERLMAQYNYPDRIAHETQHIELINQVGDLYTRVRQGEVSVSLDTMNFLKNWLNHHILETDKKLGAFLAAKGVK